MDYCKREVKMAKKIVKKFDFEKALEELEKIVEKLEEGNVPLEESISLFEKGKTLCNQCIAKLTEVEKRISVIIEKEKGTVEIKDFSPEEEETDEQEQ